MLKNIAHMLISSIANTTNTILATLCFNASFLIARILPAIILISLPMLNNMPAATNNMTAATRCTPTVHDPYNASMSTTTAASKNTYTSTSNVNKTQLSGAVSASNPYTMTNTQASQAIALKDTPVLCSMSLNFVLTFSAISWILFFISFLLVAINILINTIQNHYKLIVTTLLFAGIYMSTLIFGTHFIADISPFILYIILLVSFIELVFYNYVMIHQLEAYKNISQSSTVSHQTIKADEPTLKQQAQPSA